LNPPQNDRLFQVHLRNFQNSATATSALNGHYLGFVYEKVSGKILGNVHVHVLLP